MSNVVKRSKKGFTLIELMIVVAIVGPPKVGKSTLLQALIKNFTRQNITSIQGPVTLVSGITRLVTRSLDSDFH